MAEVYRIEIPIEVQDQTEPAVSRVLQRLTAFEQTMQRRGFAAAFQQGIQRTEQDLLRRTATMGQAVERLAQRMSRFAARPYRFMLTAWDTAWPIIQRTQEALRGLTGRAWRISVGIVGAPFRGLSRLFDTLTNVKTLVAGFMAGQAFRGGIAWPLRLAGEWEQASLAMKTFIGDAGRASDFLRRLEAFSANTSFTMPDLQGMASQLLANRFTPDQTLRILKAFGDAASLTGAGVQGMQLSLAALTQMQTIGIFDWENLKQIAENLRIGLAPVMEELGLRQDQLKDISRLGISASRGIEALLRALERPVSRGGYLGGAATQAGTFFGILSTLQDRLQPFVRAWGQGLQMVVQPRLQALNTWFEQNQATVERWQSRIQEAARRVATRVAGWFDTTLDRLRVLTQDPRWQRADFFGKVSLAWDELIAKPFNKWWEEGGRDWAVEVGGKIARALWSGFKRTSEVLLRAAWNELKQLFREHPFLTTGAIGAGLLVAVAKVGALVRDVKSLVDVFRGTPRACGCPPDQPPFTRVPMAPTSAPPVPVPGGGRGIGGALARAVPFVGAGVLGASLGYFGARWVDQHILEPLARRREQEFERRVREAPWNRPTEVARELGLNDPARISLRAAQPTLWERISRFFSAPRAYAAQAPVTPRPAIGMGDLRALESRMASLPRLTGQAVDASASQLARLPEQAGTSFSALHNQAVTWFGQIRSVAGTESAGAVEASAGAFAALPGRVGGPLAGVHGAVSQADGTWRVAALQAGLQLVSGAMSAIASLPTRVWGIVTSVANTIASGGSLFIQAARSAFGRLVAGFREALGIHSPSFIEREMERIVAVSKEATASLTGDFARLHGLRVAPTLEFRAAGFGAVASLTSPYRPWGDTTRIGMGDLRAAERRIDPGMGSLRAVMGSLRAVDQSVHVKIGTVSLSVSVEGGDGQQVLETIRRNARAVAREIADDVALEIGRGVRRVSANMPLAPRGRFGPALDPR